MEITDVRIRKINNEGNVKAVASITLDNEFVVHEIRLIEGSRGLFLGMPNKKNQQGEFKDIAHPISSKMREKILKEVLDKYVAVKESIETE